MLSLHGGKMKTITCCSRSLFFSVIMIKYNIFGLKSRNIFANIPSIGIWRRLEALSIVETSITTSGSIRNASRLLHIWICLIPRFTCIYWRRSVITLTHHTWLFLKVLESYLFKSLDFHLVWSILYSIYRFEQWIHLLRLRFLICVIPCWLSLLLIWHSRWLVFIIMPKLF